ncbi:MAG: hypothetical protein Ct9H300mP1_39280 [Planctomycetaceae bacterium]|nr:MAG: hypothetical protein Ct9H300mP1_39280 [Planctomycetaceae bacterium]
MLSINGPAPRLCDGTTRREALKIGGLGMTGLTLPSLVELSTAHAKPSADKGSSHSSSFGKAKNCIILFLSGGASHHDTFDPKPNEPAEVRGEFDQIQTWAPRAVIGEHLPRTAKWMDRVALIRLMTHESSGHAGGGYYMFTGYKYPRARARPTSWVATRAPHMGLVLSKISPGPGPMVPSAWSRVGWSRQRPTCRAVGWALGGKYDPLQTGGNPNDDTSSSSTFR